MHDIFFVIQISFADGSLSSDRRRRARNDQCYLAEDSGHRTPSRQKNPRRFAVGRPAIDRVRRSSLTPSERTPLPAVRPQNARPGTSESYPRQTCDPRRRSHRAASIQTAVPVWVRPGSVRPRTSFIDAARPGRANWMTVSQRWFGRRSFNFSRTGRQSLRRPTHITNPVGV